jgi:hypothetical protein
MHSEMQSALSWPRLAMALDDRPQQKAQPGTALSRDSVKRASAAQLLLVARLKARTRRDLARDTLERGAHVIWVTCKSWFSSGQPPSGATGDDNNNNKDTDAHRDR